MNTAGKMQDGRIRILHVLASLDLYGIQKWLVDLLEAADRHVYQMDFLVGGGQRTYFEPLVYRYGARILRCPSPCTPVQFMWHFRRLLREHGRYDVLHCHLRLASVPVLLGAAVMGIPVRILHSHMDLQNTEYDRRWHARRRAGAARWLSRRACTHGLAVSSEAASDLFGRKWRRDKKFQILHCGVDLAPFHQEPCARLRRAFGLEDRHFVVGHVGRFHAQKNHEWVVQVARELARENPDLRVVLVGEGDRRPYVERLVREASLEKHVIFAGLRDDVPSILLSAFDVFVFPSLYEGLGLAYVEAQAAGLPCVVSDRVPREGDIVPSLVHRLSLSESAAVWARTIADAAKRRIDRGAALAACKASSFNIETSWKRISEIYREAVGMRRAGNGKWAGVGPASHVV